MTELRTEGVLLVRQGGTTMAVHLPSVLVILTPIVNEPEIYPLYGMIPGPTIEGYEVEATGIADTLTVWMGDDPFAERAEIDAPTSALTEGD